jgi:hydrogenase maturation factor
MVKSLTSEDIDRIVLGMRLIDEYYIKKIDEVKNFKWLCFNHLPQSGLGYEQNKNVFDIQDKTVNDIENERKSAHDLFLKIINSEK